MRNLNEEELHSVTGGTVFPPATYEVIKAAAKAIIAAAKDALKKDPET